MANGKRFIAYDHQTAEEKTISSGFNAIAGRTFGETIEERQHHKVFEESDAKPIYHRQFLIQENNLHALNPARGKWKLVEYWEDYEHSSAKFI